ncbi:unnamed protein product [Thelazia callipaeda]|uniref:Transmembrane protein n=1 Tax=Thelazia callipaeda TaxID=103827 RepID=A0A0N5D0H7_THECL|nr:unnamed protein product [Thelazia callipaeda]
MSQEVRSRANDPEKNLQNSSEQICKNVTLTTILSQPVYDVFIQHDKNFCRIDRNQYERMLEARTNDLVSISPSESIQSALAVQTAFHDTSILVQGFLSGFATFHALFALVLADTDTLHGGYTWLAMPAQATFYICFVISTIAAFDRFEGSSSLIDNFKRGLRLQSGSLSIMLCLLGTVTTLTSVICDEWLAAPLEQRQIIKEFINVHPFDAWRILSGIRALAALLNWFFFTFSANKNMLLKHIRYPEEADVKNCNGP